MKTVIRLGVAAAASTASFGCTPLIEGIARWPIVCAIGVQPILEGENDTQIVFAPVLQNRGVGDTTQAFDIRYNVVGRSNSIGYTNATINVPAVPPVIGTHAAPGVGAGASFVVSPALLPQGARVPNEPREYEISYEIDPTETAFVGANRHCRYSGTMIYQGDQFVRMK